MQRRQRYQNENVLLLLCALLITSVTYPRLSLSFLFFSFLFFSRVPDARRRDHSSRRALFRRFALNARENAYNERSCNRCFRLFRGYLANTTRLSRKFRHFFRGFEKEKRERRLFLSLCTHSSLKKESLRKIY